MRTATVIELFAGCGGMSAGLLAAGYDVRLGIDINKSAIATYEHNHRHVGASGWTVDLRNLSGAEIRAAARLDGKRPDLLTGGPPCQPFSIIGKRQAFEDARGDLVIEYVRLLREIEPKAFIFENVANFAGVDGGRVAKLVLSSMEAAGYAVSHAVLNASEYGVPQMRKRFFVLGVRGSKAPSMPAPTHGDMALLGQKAIRTCRDALGDLPDVDTEAALSFHNHEGTCHSPAMIKMFESLAPGTRDPKSHHDRLHPDRPAYTLRAGNGNFSPLRPIHYRYNRVISVRESARLQGFPDTFVWPISESRLQQYRQVGNAVPPPMALVLGRHLASNIGLSLDPERFGRPSDAAASTPSPSIKERIAQRRSYIRGASVGRTTG